MTYEIKLLYLLFVCHGSRSLNQDVACLDHAQTRIQLNLQVKSG